MGIDFLNKLLNIQRPLPKKHGKLETLVAFLVPKKILVDKTYKQRNAVAVNEDYQEYFTSCVWNVASHFSEIHGPDFSFAKTSQESGKLEHTFIAAITRAQYHLIGADRWSDTHGDTWSNEIIANLILQQPQIDLQKAGKFLTLILENHLLDYRSWKAQRFGIFYSRPELKGASKVQEQEKVLEGLSLLEKCGIKPREAAELKTVMYFAYYQHRIFTPAEKEAGYISFPETTSKFFQIGN